MKKGCAILFLFLTSLIYGQNSTLLQNTNFRAKALKHFLNKTGDSLILESKETIYKVAIFNTDFERTFAVGSKKTTIPLTDIPVGRFVTEVKVNDKLIIITLLRHKPYTKVGYASTNTSNNEKAVVDGATLLNNYPGKEKKIIIPKKPVRFYWIVRLINKGHSSSKVMRIGDKEVVDKMIVQNKIDLKSKAGKHNELIIWEVYDTSAFMRFKRLNPDYANVEEADSFNTEPFYKSGS